jgi:hypothetical protein
MQGKDKEEGKKQGNSQKLQKASQEDIKEKKGYGQGSAYYPKQYVFAE